MEIVIPSERRRVKQAIPVWKANLPEDFEHLPAGPIAPVGELIWVDAFEELRVVRRTRNRGEKMVLVAWDGSLYLVSEDDLEERTIRVFRAFRRS
jgi:hypothetical protein